MRVDPLPHWIQYPAFMFLLIGVGVCIGFQLGILWEHWISKFVDWLFGKRVAHTATETPK